MTTLPADPPRYDTFSAFFVPLRQSETSWRVYALQSALNSIRYDEKRDWQRLAPDGVFSAEVDVVVRAYQQSSGLVVDGVVGPRTQEALLEWCCRRVDGLLPGLPDGLMRGFVIGEGMNLLAATNWSVSGGVDCGPAQLRVYGPPYPLTSPDRVGLTLAFNPVRSLLHAANGYLSTLESFMDEPAVLAHSRPLEFAMRCAIMAHNWPTAGGADHIARTGKCSNPGNRCTWVPRDANGQSKVKFADGAPVETRWDWCQHYAMGGAHGEALISRHVEKWA